MKIQHKITILFLALVGILILFLFGYQFIQTQEQTFSLHAKAKSDKQIIDEVLQIKAEKYFKPTKQTADWDYLVNYTKTRDTMWINNNLKLVLSTFDMSYLSIFDRRGNILTVIHDTSDSYSLSSAEISTMDLFMNYLDFPLSPQRISYINPLQTGTLYLQKNGILLIRQKLKKLQALI
jgi:sensor domain CHASE-containing protein